jgi:diacylglycerol kinase (ATP)
MEKNIIVLCNPLAGNGKAVKLAQQIRQYLATRQIQHTLFVGSWPAKIEGFTDIFLIGGDGTVNYFINHYPEIEIPLAIFDGGTGNDLYWMLHGSKNFEEQMKTALETAPRKIDCGICNDRYFMNGVGLGFEGEVAKSLTGKKKLPGKTSFYLTVVKKIFFYPSRLYKISCEQVNKEARELIVSITNGQRAGGGFHISPLAKTDDSLLDLVIVDPILSFKRLFYLPVIEKGKHLSLPFVHHYRIKLIKIESNSLMNYHIDGEFLSADSITISVMPGRFTIRY